jgi:starch synthase
MAKKIKNKQRAKTVENRKEASIAANRPSRKPLQKKGAVLSSSKDAEQPEKKQRPQQVQDAPKDNTGPQRQTQGNSAKREATPPASSSVSSHKQTDQVPSSPAKSAPAKPASGPVSDPPQAEPSKKVAAVKPAEPKATADSQVDGPAESRELAETSIVDQLPPISEPDEEKVQVDVPEYLPEHEPAPMPMRSMYVVMITPELAHVAKVGGLADVVYGLSRELELRGNAVEIILPKYDCLDYGQIWGLSQSFPDLWVPWYEGAIHCSVWFGFVHGRKCFFIDSHSTDQFFNRGCFYGQNDDAIRYAFFCRAAMEFMWKAGKQPDIIHCHDWQTALAPVLLYEMYEGLGMRHPRVCYTVHNFKHQGLVGADVLRATGLHRPEYFFSRDRLQDNHHVGALNLMKGAIVYSNFVTTVSPRHCWEAKEEGQAHGLEPTLHTHHYKFGGVLNGLDYHVFNPEIDSLIPVHYSPESLAGKYANKAALRQRLLLADNEKPIIAFIGRLDPQKGLDLVRHAIFYSINHRAQFVLLGSSGDPSINNHFWALKREINEHPDVHLEIGFDEGLAHLIYAGADMMIVPSRYEPCGLTQMIALKYGTVPIVRSVGGLADTIIDKDYSDIDLQQRNGFVFHDADLGGIESALYRAICLYYDYPEHFRHLICNGMRCDYSWKKPGQDYLNIYDYIRQK